MSILTDLEAALEAVDAARKTLALPLPISEVAYLEREEALYSALETYHKLATDDTIAALVAVACRAREHMEAWDSMEEAVNERHKVLYEEQHGQFVSDQWKAELSAAIREANVVEHRTAEALAAALAQLVKEADHE